MLLEVRLEAHQDLDRVGHRGLVHVDLLEPSGERAILLEVLAELLVGGGAHGAQLAALERGLQQVGGVHRPAGGRARTDHGVDLVDEEDRVGMILHLLHDRLQPLLEVAAVAGAGEKRAHVEAVDRGAGQDLGRLALDDLPGEAFRDRGLAHAGVAHQERVVLAPAAEHLDATLDLRLAPDQRIDVALERLDVEVDAILRQRRFLGVAGLALGRLMALVGTRDGARLAEGRVLGHAVRDVVHGVVARHVLLLQEEGRVRLALREDRDEDVGPRHLGPARGLHVDRGALDDALEGGGGHGLRPLHVRHEGGEVVVDEVD